jgi:hypothetical protein
MEILGIPGKIYRCPLVDLLRSLKMYLRPHANARTPRTTAILAVIADVTPPVTVVTASVGNTFIVANMRNLSELLRE